MKNKYTYPLNPIIIWLPVSATLYHPVYHTTHSIDIFALTFYIYLYFKRCLLFIMVLDIQLHESSASKTLTEPPYHQFVPSAAYVLGLV